VNYKVKSQINLLQGDSLGKVMKGVRSQNCKDSSLGILDNMHWLYWKAGDIFRKPVLTAAKTKTGNFEIGNLKVNDHCSHSEVV
jgi:hypothetical protein